MLISVGRVEGEGKVDETVVSHFFFPLTVSGGREEIRRGAVPSSQPPQYPEMGSSHPMSSQGLWCGARSEGFCSSVFNS